MRIREYSDLHLEWMGDYAETFVRELPNDCDVLVLAGDIDSPGLSKRDLRETLGWFGDRFKRVLYVHGNHEFYGAHPPDIRAMTMNACMEIENVFWLEGRDIDIDGQRFLGCTLWFPDPAVADASMYGGQDLRSFMADFQYIQGFEPWVYRQADASRRWLLESVRPKDVVVTHHLPSPTLVHPKFARSALNRYFVHDCEEILRLREPRLWINGHTHSSHDTMFSATRMVCNPYGYHGHELNADFDRSFTVEI